jgi:hypothetical protein
VGTWLPELRDHDGVEEIHASPTRAGPVRAGASDAGSGSRSRRGANPRARGP